MSEAPVTVSAAEEARKRREARKARILGQGSSRLDKLTGAYSKEVEVKEVIPKNKKEGGEPRTTGTGDVFNRPLPEKLTEKVKEIKDISSAGDEGPKEENTQTNSSSGSAGTVAEKGSEQIEAVTAGTSARGASDQKKSAVAPADIARQLQAVRAQQTERSFHIVLSIVIGITCGMVCGIERWNPAALEMVGLDGTIDTKFSYVSFFFLTKLTLYVGWYMINPSTSNLDSFKFYKGGKFLYGSLTGIADELCLFLFFFFLSYAFISLSVVPGLNGIQKT